MPLKFSTNIIDIIAHKKKDFLYKKNDCINI